MTCLPSFSSPTRLKTACWPRWLFPGVAIEKVIAGIIQALAAGLMVIPAGWLLLRPGLELSLYALLTFMSVLLPVH